MSCNSGKKSHQERKQGCWKRRSIWPWCGEGKQPCHGTEHPQSELWSRPLQGFVLDLPAVGDRGTAVPACSEGAVLQSVPWGTAGTGASTGGRWPVFRATLSSETKVGNPWLRGHCLQALQGRWQTNPLPDVPLPCSSISFFCHPCTIIDHCHPSLQTPTTPMLQHNEFLPTVRNTAMVLSHHHNPGHTWCSFVLHHGLIKVPSLALTMCEELTHTRLPPTQPAQNHHQLQ